MTDNKDWIEDEKCLFKDATIMKSQSEKDYMKLWGTDLSNNIQMVLVQIQRFIII